MKIYSNILELVGNTPLVRLNNLTKDCFADVVAKVEYLNPSCSIKDRAAIAMIDAAEKAGLIKENATIIEPTSGNTGIALAMICAIKGYKLIIAMPESVSIERRKLIQHYGAQIVLTSREGGISEAVKKAYEIHEKTENSFIPMQFNNQANPEMHYNTTAEEIYNDTEGKVDIVVCGVGTGGTLTGVAKRLKQKKSDVKIIAVEPEESAVLSGNPPAPHGIQGIGAGFIPQILETSLIDEIIKIKTPDAIKAAQELSKQEGILAGISAGAAVKVAIDVAKRPENKGKLIVVIIPDSAERYLSTPLFQE